MSEVKRDICRMITTKFGCWCRLNIGGFCDLVNRLTEYMESKILESKSDCTGKVSRK